MRIDKQNRQTALVLVYIGIYNYFVHIKQNMLMSDISKTYRRYDNTYMSHDMWFPTIWYFDKCRLRRASAASF